MRNPLNILILTLLSTLSINAVNISGTISYERVHPLHKGSSTSLDWNHITTEKAKQVTVEAINSSGETIASTSTDDSGNYLLKDLPSNTNVKIRVYAKMYKKSMWDVKVVDNTNQNALYVLEGSLVSTGDKSSRRSLKAPAQSRQSPPFAILDSIYRSMKKVLTADKSVLFPPLKLNWSINNTESGTYYDGNDNIMIQGDQKGDSDEYDDHIIIHEWGHYFEAKFSRADSIGGNHASGNYLDIRLAFGEGWGNALSGVVTDDPIYFDTMTSSGVSRGWNMNVESATHDTPGWFSEASIQRILYDLYDSHDDDSDHLSLGFKPIYDVLVGSQKTTKAFTSIFTFITALKEHNSNYSDKIDSIIANEDIATINDIYGSNRLNNTEEETLPIYSSLTVDKTLDNICTTNTYGLNNKLNNHKYIKFTINKSAVYPIRVEQNNGTLSDPDFILFKTSPFTQVALRESAKKGIEEDSIELKKGNYLLDIYNTNNINRACFYISVGEVTLKGEKREGNTNSSNSVGLSFADNPLKMILLALALSIIPALFIRKELKI